MDPFKIFANALNTRTSDMSHNELYVVGDALDKDKLWETYLDSFPVGTNPMFRERTEHNCSTCRQFIKGFGNVVEIVDGKVRTIWDRPELLLQHPYDQVAAVMNDFVLSLPLTGVFRTSERQYGAEKTNSLHEGELETWHHFFGRVADRHHSNDVGANRGNFDAAVQVLGRGLEEIHRFALDTVIDLIDNNSLYRGEEHLAAITAFRSLHSKWWNMPVQTTVKAAKQAFIYANATSSAARFRNTVIGTLVDDLSKGVDLEAAVRSFEAKVAPTNYKRPKSLITPAMVKSAMKTIDELGVERSLERRFAQLSDVSVNNVLWVNNDTQRQMKDGIEGLLLAAATPLGRKPKGEAEKVSIVSFMKDILPGASEVELFIKNSHEPNFVSLTTGQHNDAPNLFKWSNDFAWSYGGNVTDSIKEKVKRAGGSVTGTLRVSLSWFNTDDLDLHLDEANGNHIYYGNRGSVRGGQLDVDMNVSALVTDPVENITWARTAADGVYKVRVHQYNQRNTSNVGFLIETENNGKLEQYSYDKRVSGYVEVGSIDVKDGVIVKFTPGKGIVGGSASKELWNVKTEQFTPVTTILYSPNHWDGEQQGNRHYLFMLKDCVTDTPIRGLYNEFLRSDLEKHRKVFEVLGSKTLCEPSSDQLSGVGFSSTAGASVGAKVLQGSRQRFIEIQF